MKGPIYQVAASPFNRPDADVILRSSNGSHFHFHVHRNILMMASPFFEDMFHLPVPHNENQTDRPIIDVPEDSATLDILLRVCYPVAVPLITTVKQARSVLDAALKYDMITVKQFATRMLETFVQAEPLRVYAIAARHGLDRLAKVAARQAVQKNAVTDSYVPELEDMPAGCYYRLLQYQRRVNNSTVFVFCRPKHNIATKGPSRETELTERNAPSPFDAVDADVVMVTTDNMRFCVHKSIITSASPVWTTLLQEQVSESGPASYNEETCGPRILQISERSNILQPLLQLIYPSGLPISVDNAALPSLLDAANKYQLQRVSWILLPKWSEFVASDPLSSYLLACSRGLKEQVIHSARSLLSRTYNDLVNTYVGALEAVPTGPYYRLLQFHKRCGQAARSFFDSQTRKDLEASSSFTLVTCDKSPCNGNSYRYASPKWYSSYVVRAKRCLEVQPSVSTFRLETITFLVKEMGCLSCMMRIKEVLAFCSAFEDAVDKVISEVSTDILFN
ncbi:uncharacterized protein FIBRA_08619 [Fibroporia radiculosa]|uniref:BTB domain-containing protein n=1 Tax=Fibroporia radiculosa TaxID=599839 RepID=J4I321_9APHY|nr:uncharacterized protein FIBRA_08619 [Fibroporia radiculosa]CCM06362.1 predicted protein [Fibroporia radiculosa]